VFTALAAVDPVLDLAAVRHSVPNPIGIASVGDVDEGPLPVLLVGLLSSALTATGLLVARLFRARGHERQQLKWFTFSTALLLLGFVVGAVFDAITGERIPILDQVLLALPGTGAGVAILRHRLYDIDIIINRTLVYGVLSAFLAAAYAGGVALLQYLLPLEDEIAVAASTLAIAALFRPLRERVQRFIDRRFYRSKYDAEKTVDDFSARLRDEVDLDELRQHLLEVVDRTMQPAAASVWLRSSAPEGAGATGRR